MYQVGYIFKLDNEYSKIANYCNNNGLVIEEIEKDENGERQFKIVEIPAPTEEELKDMRIREIQQRLTELDQDIVQDIVGEAVPNIEKRKAEFVTLHNELRTLLGKEPRALKT